MQIAILSSSNFSIQSTTQIFALVTPEARSLAWSTHNKRKTPVPAPLWTWTIAEWGEHADLATLCTGGRADDSQERIILFHEQMKNF